MEVFVRVGPPNVLLFTGGATLLLNLSLLLEIGGGALMLLKTGGPVN